MGTMEIPLRLVELLAEALAVIACTIAGCASYRIGARWSRFWLTLVGLIVVLICRRTFEARLGRLTAETSCIWWATWWTVLAGAAFLQSRTITKFISTGDNLMRSREMTKSMEKANGGKARRCAKDIEKAADKIQKQIDSDGER